MQIIHIADVLIMLLFVEFYKKWKTQLQKVTVCFIKGITHFNTENFSLNTYIYFLTLLILRIKLQHYIANNKTKFRTS